MWATVKRLSLGVLLILSASAVLLLSDLGRRKPDTRRLPRVAILQHVSQSLLNEGVQGMLDGLAENGFVDGKTVSIRRYNAEGDGPTANAIAKEITDGRYDMVLTASTLSLQAVANANRAGKTRHVFALVTDPFAAGVGINRDKPTDHPRWLAGYGTMQPVAETLRLAKQMYPGLTRLGVAWNPAEANSEIQVAQGRAVSRELGIELIETNVDNASGVAEAVGSLIGRGIQALWVDGDVTVLTAIDAVIATARKAGLPVFTCMPGSADHGALFDLGANYHEVGRLTGELAARILKGADPATIAVVNLMPERLIVNKQAFAGLKDPWQLPAEVAKRAVFVGEAGGAATPAAVAKSAAVPPPPPGRTFKIGLAYFAPEPGADICIQGLFDGLRELGFVEGKNLDVIRAHAQGEIANIPAVLQSLDSQGLDLIVPLTTPCLTAACGTVKHTPVVFTYVYDPLAAGVGISFNDHNPNVTGVGSFPPVADTAAMIERLVPGVQRVGTLYNSSEANSRKVIEVARDAFKARNLALEEVTVTNSNEVYQAAQALAARNVQAFWITGDNTAIQGFDAIVKVANDAHLPIVNNDPELVARGALACVGIGFYQSGYAAATHAARVLLGTPPAAIPIEDVAQQTILVNLDQARLLNWEIPPDLVRTADTVIDSTGQRAKTSDSPKPAAPAPLSRTWKVDVLQYINVQDVEDGERGVREGLRDAGLVAGRDYTVQVRNAQGDMPTLSALVDAAISGGADLLLTFSTPTLQAAVQRARALPVVFTFVADGVAAGAGRTNDDHLPNVTGISTASAYDDMLAVVQECLPGAHKIGTLFVPAEVNSIYSKDQMTRLSAARGLEFVTVAANTTAEVSDATLSLLAHGVDAIVQVAGNVTSAGFVSIAQPALRAKVPVFGFLSSDMPNGAVVVVARDYFDAGREAGLMAARVMRGESPAKMPFKPLTTTRLLINLESARGIGMTVPPALVQRAAQVIGR